MEQKLSMILRRVQKPTRYVGGELSGAVFNPDTRVRFCACTPKLYEEGMADKNANVLYYMLNDRKGYSCERCFAPYVDMANELKKAGMELFSLETRTPLKKFDLLNFHFKAESEYSNLLYMLSLGGVELERKDRREGAPFVYASGVVTANPEPLADFLDFAIIGDIEDVTIKVIDTVMKAKLSRLSRMQTLDNLAKIEGVYVYSKFDFDFDKNGDIKKITGKPVKRQVLRDLERAYYPSNAMISNEHLENDCYKLEIMRGCTRGCRFCQAGYISRPRRERRVQSLVSKATAAVIRSGVDKIELLSPANGDYSHLDELLASMKTLSADRNVRIFMRDLNQNYEISGSSENKKKIEYELSLEAGTERLRNIINKCLSDEEAFASLKSAFLRGVNQLNLKFMVGLPYETTADLMGIVETINKIKQLYKKYQTTSRKLKISVEFKTFVPKAYTAFMWCSFVPVKEATKRLALLKMVLSKLGVTVKIKDPRLSEIEAIFSRGDRRLGKVLKYAYLHGAIFDYNSEMFNPSAYSVAFNKTGVDKEWYLKRFDKDTIFAFDAINMGVDKSYLYSEYEKAKEGVVTCDCKRGCNGCGLYKMGVCQDGHN